MSDPLPPRTLGILPLVVTIGVAAWAFQWWVASWYTPPDRLRYRAAAVVAKAREAPHDLVILGTCMSEQQINATLVAEAVGPPWTVHNLGARASGPIDWYLTLKNRIPEGTVEALVVAWIRGDLEANPSVWEGHTMDLADWGDLPELAELTCEDDPGCAVEMGLRRASFAYRNRGFLANLLWTRLGARASLPALADEPREENAITPPPLPPPPLPAGRPLTAEDGNLETDGPPQAPPEPESAVVAHRYLLAMLQLAREQGIPVWFARMPERADAPEAPARPQYAIQDDRIRALVAEGGGVTIDLPHLPGGQFIDDRHVTGQGSRTISTALGEALKAGLAGASAAPAAPDPAPAAPDPAPSGG